MIDRNAILARLELIADTLGLPYSEVERAVRGDGELIAFARRHNQSLDFICLGDVRNLIRLAHRSTRRWD